MKKTLKKDITKYDKKMQLRFDKDTLKAGIISLILVVPLFLLINLTLGTIPAVFISFLIGCIAMLLQIGKVDGISLLKYIFKIFNFVLFAKNRKKCYAQDSGEYRIKISIDRETKERKNKK